MMLRWLIRDVFRQARATGLTATLVVLGAFATLVAATASHSDNRLTTLFGLVTIQETKSAEESYHVLRTLIAGAAADTLGVLLALVWTAGFLPSFLDPASVSVLLAKPPGRYRLFLGKTLAILAYVAVYAVIVVTATAIGLGVATGEWPAGYWLGIPLLVVHFAVFYGFSALIAVATRGAAASVVGTLMFWAVCFGMNYARHVLTTQTVEGAAASVGRVANLGYWLLPKPADFGLILSDALGGDKFALPLVDFPALKAAGAFAPEMSVAASLAFGAAFLGLAAFEFAHEDY